MYKGHARFNLFLALPILIGGIHYFFDPTKYELFTFASVFTYCTLFMNPDLDMADQIKLISIRGVLTIPFRSYAKFFSHRGISHNLILGSLSRIIWILGWTIVVFFLLYKTLPTKATILKFYFHYETYIRYSLAGICLADWCHLLLDRKEFRNFG